MKPGKKHQKLLKDWDFSRKENIEKAIVIILVSQVVPGSSIKMFGISMVDGMDSLGRNNLITIRHGKKLHKQRERLGLLLSENMKQGTEKIADCLLVHKESIMLFGNRMEIIWDSLVF